MKISNNVIALLTVFVVVVSYYIYSTYFITQTTTATPTVSNSEPIEKPTVSNSEPIEKPNIYQYGVMDSTILNYRVYKQPRLTLFNTATGLTQSDITSVKNPTKDDCAKLGEAVPKYLKSINRVVDYNYIGVLANGAFDLYKIPIEIKPKVIAGAIGVKEDGLVGGAVFTFGM